MTRGVLRGLMSLFCIVSLSVQAAESWFAADLNHRESGLHILVVDGPDGQPWLRVLDLDELGIPWSADTFHRSQGERFVPAAALVRHEAHVDEVARRVRFVSHARPHWPTGVPADLLLDIRVNGMLLAEPQYVKNTGSDLVLPAETLEAIRVALPEAYGPFLEGEMPVHAVAAENFHFSLERLYLELTVKPELLSVTTLSPSQPWRPPALTDASPSLVMAYALRGGETTDQESWYSAFGDLALSKGRTTCRTRHFHSSLGDDTRRLDTNCIVDWPDIPLSAGAGDNFTRPAVLREIVSYGGVWIGSDFGLQPYRNLQPSLIVDGNARLPSTLEIWMDQRLGLRQEIPPGPFTVENLPAVTGGGEVQAVLVNAAGRQVIVSEPIYSDPRLITPGVLDWRVEVGKLRPGSADGNLYTDDFMAGFARTGLTDWATGEVTAERTRDLSKLGAAIALRAWNLGLIELGASRSRFDSLSGSARFVSYTLRGRHLQFGASVTDRDDAYVGLGFPEPGLAPSIEKRANAGISNGPWSLTLSHLERRYDNRPEGDARLASATFALRAFRLGQVAFTATRNLELPAAETVYMALLSVPLGRRGLFHHSTSRDDGRYSHSTGYTLSPPPGPGFGYRLYRDALPEFDRHYAEATLRGSRAESGISAQHVDGAGTNWDAYVQGAVVANRAGAALTRDDGNSFALIDTGSDVAGLGILREHQLAAHTSSGGRAVVPGLRPYQSNRIGLDVGSLPFASAIETRALEVVPGRRGVVIADFGFRRTRELLATLRPTSGTEIPAGAIVNVNGARAGVTGYGGVIYVEMPDADHFLIEVNWPGGSCSASMEIENESGGIVEAGEIACHTQ